MAILNIGTATFTVTHIIYVSPTGNDANNGLDRSTPFLTFTKAINTVLTGGAICFLTGTHDFTDQFTSIENPAANMYFFRDLGKALIFYSEDPLKTKLNFITTRGTTSYGRTQFMAFTNDSTKLFNLNLYFKAVTTSVYDGLLYGWNSGYINIYNCLIRVQSPWAKLYWGHGVQHPNFINCVITSNQTVSGDVADPYYHRPSFNNCILLSNTGTTVCTAYNIIDNTINSSTDLVLIKRTGTGDPNILPNGIGITGGPYTEWLQKRYIISTDSAYISIDSTLYNTTLLSYTT